MKKSVHYVWLPISEVPFPFIFTKCHAGSGFSFFLAYGYATRQIVPLSHSAPFVYILTMTFSERRAGRKLVPPRLCIGILQPVHNHALRLLPSAPRLLVHILSAQESL